MDSDAPVAIAVSGWLSLIPSCTDLGESICPTAPGSLVGCNREHEVLLDL